MSAYLPTDCEDVARHLLDDNYNCPKEFLNGPIQQRLALSSITSDLIFNYLSTAMTVDNPEGEPSSPSIDETATALALLANHFEVTPDEIAKHYASRL
jgi:hypothetical protein